MAIPDFQTFMLPLLKTASDGQEHTLAEAINKLAQEFQLSEEDRSELLPSGRQPRVNNRVGWARMYLRKAGLLTNVRRGSFKITERGTKLLEDPPSRIDMRFLQTHFVEINEVRREDDDEPASFNVDEGAWTTRAAVAQRIREKMERSFPDETTRLAALNFFAFGIENADEERGDAWYVRETTTGLRLMAGGLLACEVARKRIKVSVIGPISDEMRTTLGADSDEDDESLETPRSAICSTHSSSASLSARWSCGTQRPGRRPAPSAPRGRALERPRW